VDWINPGGIGEMERQGISKVAITSNAAWIEAVENAIADCGDTVLTKEVMKAAGQKCARQILDDCREILGKEPETVDELLHATNQRRLQKHNLASQWIKEGNKARLKIEECNCTLVKAGLAKPNPVHCLCSAGLMEGIFSTVCQGSVSVEIVRAIGFGDDVCEFCINFTE
jgi:predicted hydrocarbon binding protein